MTFSLKTPSRARNSALVAALVSMLSGLPVVKADDPAWSKALMERVGQVDARRLPSHPRLLLSDANVEHIRVVGESSFGAPYRKVVTDWLETERTTPPLPDPAPQKQGPGGKRDISEFRRIQVAAEQVESHVVLACGLFRVTHDPKYLEQARAWVEAVTQWDPHGATGIKSDDYAARQTLHALAVAYDGLYAEWTSEERTAIRASLLARGDDLYRHLQPFTLDEYNNHPWFQCSALIDAGLALADESPEADRWWRYGAELYLKRFLPVGDREGGWHEGINYLTFTMKYVCQFANSLAGATGIDPFDSIPWLRKAGYFRLYLAPANSIGIYLNDTRPLTLQQWDKPTAFRLASETHDPIIEWYAEWLPQTTSQPTSSFYTLLYRELGLTAQTPASLPLARHFPEIGWIATRTDLTSGQDVEFGFKSQPWSGTDRRAKGHDHPDANNFLLNFLGKPLLVDSGYYDYYGSPHHKGWTFTGRAHNTLLIDGQEQLARRPGKIISFISRPGTFDWIEGEGAASYPDGLLKSWRRQVLYLRPDLFVIRDLVRPVKPATITWLLHGASPFELEGQAFVCRNEDAAVAGVIAAPGNLQVRQWIGYLAGAEPERTTESEKREFPDESHLEFITPEKVGDTTFITVFSPGRSNDLKRPRASIASSEHGDAVTIQLGDGKAVHVTFAPVSTDDEPSVAPIVTY